MTKLFRCATLAVLCAGWTLALHGAQAQGDVVFPTDAGVVNVKTEFGAKGDGMTDDTKAIQSALDRYPAANKIIYLPAGTYRVSGTLRWPAGKSAGGESKRTILQGQSEAKTVLRLPDNCPGFDNPAAPRSVVYTGRAPAQRFRNSIRNLTVDTGRGNPGAIGVQYIANNQGSIHFLTIRSGDGQGVIGLDLGYTNEQGPCLIKNVTVQGFDVGISTKYAVDSVVLEHVRLRNQNRFGFVNDGQCLSVRGLDSQNAVPALVNKGAGVVTLIDSNLRGTGAAAAQTEAILNTAALFVRNVIAPGYGAALQSVVGKAGTKTVVRGPRIEEWVSHPALTLFADTPKRSLNLPIRETPDVPWGDLSQWAGPQQFGGVGDGKTDNTRALQQAIDSGKTTLYLPNGNWRFDGEVIVRGKVARVIGCEAKLSGKGTLKIGDGAAPVVRVERLELLYSDVRIEHATRRTLALSSVCLGNVGFVTHAASGDLFIEDVVGTPWKFFPGQRVWARQWNAEGTETKIESDGATLWILGLKSEGDGTLLSAQNNAHVELVGGFAYANTARVKAPMFVVKDSALSATIGEFVIRKAPFLQLVVETRKTETRTLRPESAPGRGGGAMLPLFVGGAPTKK